MRDAVVGVFKIYHINKELQAMDEAKAKEQRTLEPSSLARRRAQRHKTDPILSQIRSPGRLMPSIINCCLWNMFALLISVFVFGFILPQGLSMAMTYFFADSVDRLSYISPLVTGVLWFAPIIVITKFVNLFWFQDIADCVYRAKRGRPQTLMSFSNVVADIVYNCVLEALFFLQCSLAKHVPIVGVGEFLNLLHLSFMYSLYAFEYDWFNRGWSVQQRIRKIEHNWPYFVGFGLPLAILGNFFSFIANVFIFSMVFTPYIISAIEANPIQMKIKLPLNLFSPSIYVANFLVRRSVKRKPEGAAPPPVSASGTPKKVTLQEQHSTH